MKTSKKDDLRPVEIESRYSDGGNVISIQTTKGFFHRWGEKLDYITDQATSLYGAAVVIGIVETEDGQVFRVPADSIRFLDRE
jgi:hypothetical protein